MASGKIMIEAKRIARHFGHPDPKPTKSNHVFWILDVPTKKGSRAKLRFLKERNAVGAEHLQISLRYCNDHKLPESFRPESPEQAIKKIESLLSDN